MFVTKHWLVVGLAGYEPLLPIFNSTPIAYANNTLIDKLILQDDKNVLISFFDDDLKTKIGFNLQGSTHYDTIINDDSVRIPYYYFQYFRIKNNKGLLRTDTFPFIMI
ncbi:Uncharacterised protein [uncultured archaeon]|nr:Uncharacterised protein [uncultured archaeon]